MSGALLTHEVQGEGEPLLLLNGGMMTFASWAPVSSVLARDFKVILCDLRGQLLSPGPVPEDLAANVDDLCALLDHLGIDSAHVVGTSYGGEIGLLMAALAPQRVRSLIGVTVSDYATEAIWQGSEDLRILVHESRLGGDKGRIHDRIVSEVYSAAYREANAEELATRRSQVSLLPESWFEGVEGILVAIEGLDLRPHMEAVRCPTLIVIAGDDRSIPPERSVALAALIDGATTRTHKTSGHALVAEDPAWLSEVMLDFLSHHRTSKS
jgi:pimeloyl-ACP methyl ester carboxylesterase